MSVGAIVPVRPSGETSAPARLLRVGDRTVLARVVESLVAMDAIDRVVVVVPASLSSAARVEVESLHISKPVSVCVDGSTRQQAIRAGLAAIGPCDYVVIHDSSRPFASGTLLKSVLAEAMKSGAAIPGIRPTDAVMRVDGGKHVESLERSQLILAQSPQAFLYELLRRAHYVAADSGLLGDDDQLVAAIGHAVTVVEGESTNLEVATLEDVETLLDIVTGLRHAADH